METLYPNLYRTDPGFIDVMKYGTVVPLQQGQIGTLYGINVYEDEDKSSWLME